ncbi:MAG: endonuclease domain-containing protein [Neisseria sp.]|nr:endonuclease domain-containing protein [Neisseria sp.]
MPRNHQQTQRARALRTNPTEAEQRLWQQLRGKQLHGIKFRRQHNIGRYIVDFVNLERKLVIELDGGQHAEQLDYDHQRTAYLESQGFRVLRFWNHEVLQQTIEVLAEIERHCRIATDSPPP